MFRHVAPRFFNMQFKENRPINMDSVNINLYPGYRDLLNFTPMLTRLAEESFDEHLEVRPELLREIQSRPGLHERIINQSVNEVKEFISGSRHALHGVLSGHLLLDSQDRPCQERKLSEITGQMSKEQEANALGRLKIAKLAVKAALKLIIRGKIDKIISLTVLDTDQFNERLIREIERAHQYFKEEDEEKPASNGKSFCVFKFLMADLKGVNPADINRELTERGLVLSRYLYRNDAIGIRGGELMLIASNTDETNIKNVAMRLVSNPHYKLSMAGAKYVPNCPRSALYTPDGSPRSDSYQKGALGVLMRQVEISSSLAQTDPGIAILDGKNILRKPGEPPEGGYMNF
jgi:hypothetical protein